MKKTLMAAVVVAALTLVGGAAYADGFIEMMTKTERMIADAEQKGDMTNAAEARRLTAEAKSLYDQGQSDAALVRVVRGMMLAAASTRHGGPNGNRSRTPRKACRSRRFESSRITGRRTTTGDGARRA